MAIKSFDKSSLIALRSDLNKKLKAIESELGVVIKLGNCKFSEKNAMFQMEVCAIGDEGEVETREATAFKMNAVLYGFQPTDLGRVFATPTGEYRITGLNTRAGKHPILAVDVRTGKGYKFPETVSRFLK